MGFRVWGIGLSVGVVQALGIRVSDCGVLEFRAQVIKSSQLGHRGYGEGV